ncbi:hypothetical protein TrRE_jg8054 [Triparma retinervis]|uniref:Uncharacterized protein n=1 Tax=Triparma retinervis TaxID=2557542 RepID=A0A9W7AHG7_9STRA|nr:hypothetical protein TrRE_jg8054 [Triparma retinervis]
MGLNDFEGDIMSSDDDSLSSRPKDHARFEGGGEEGLDGEDKDHRVYRKTGAGQALKFGSFNIDDIDDDDDDDDDGDDDGGGGKGGDKEAPDDASDDDERHVALKSGGLKSGLKKSSFGPSSSTSPSSTSASASSTATSGATSSVKEKGGSIRFGGEDTTVDFDVKQSVADLPKKRQFRKTGAPKFTVSDLGNEGSDEESVGNFLDSDDQDTSSSAPATSPGVGFAPTSTSNQTAKIQKRYRKTGVSFGNYSMDDEDDTDDSDSPPSAGHEVPPSDSLLNASPAYLKFRSETKASYDTLQARLDDLESGLASVSTSKPQPATGSVELNNLDLSFQYGLASGGAGRELDVWGTLVLLIHLAMIVVTILFLADAGVGDRAWMGVFLAFLIVTLAKWCGTMNKVKVRDGGNGTKKESVVIKAEQA